MVMLAAVALTMGAAGRFERLDSLIEAQPRIIAEKEAHLARLKADLAHVSEPASRYAALHQLYDEYAAYQYDSAHAYVAQCFDVARAMGNEHLVNASRLDLLHILSVGSLMNKAQQVAEQVDTTQLTADQMIAFRRTQINMRILQSEYIQGSPYTSEYLDRLVNLRREIAAMDAPQENINYQLTVAEYDADNQHYDKAINRLTGLLPQYHSGERLYSIITSTLAFFYLQQGDTDKQLEYLVKSAESDLEGCIRENTALRVIADRLFDEGDIDRAYHYMRVAVDDANFFGARLRNIQLSHIMPKILSAYQTKQDRNHRNMLGLLVTLSVIALMLVVGVMAIYQLLKRSNRLNKQNEVMNDQLHQVNEQLEDTVEQLRESNGQLHEREKLKEEYIARFLSLSSRFIDRGEDQRKQLYRLHREHKSEELARALHSTHFGSENAQLFYENFDNAFLNIYPNFVTEVNKLLLEGGKIEVKEGKRLTTESRVLALIRIGITDNQSIANILRASLTTIYTYRSKLRSRAVNKEDFEENVKKIDSSI